MFGYAAGWNRSRSMACRLRPPFASVWRDLCLLELCRLVSVGNLANVGSGEDDHMKRAIALVGAVVVAAGLSACAATPHQEDQMLGGTDEMPNKGGLMSQSGYALGQH